MYEASYPESTMWRAHTHERFLGRLNCSSSPAVWVFPAQVTDVSEEVVMMTSDTATICLHPCERAMTTAQLSPANALLQEPKK